MENVQLKKQLAGEYPFGFHDDVKNVYEFKKGLDEDVVRKISKIKNEPEWMLTRRLDALKIFQSKPTPTWGADLSHIDFDDIIYYVRPTDKPARSWDDVPEKMKQTFEKLGIPEAERKFLAGAGAQYDSESVYHKLREDLEKQGVVFLDMDSGLREHEDIVKKYFGSVIPSSDNKFAALNTAVWSGGSFLYVPKGVHVEVPLQAYFRINTKNMGQFERTLIIAEPGSSVHYLEGCFTAGTPIQTIEGTKPIENVTADDHVFTHKNRFRKVKRTQVRPYSGKLYKITYFGDSTQQIEATNEHPFWAVRRKKSEYTNTEWKPEWVAAEKLDPHDYLGIPINREVRTEEYRSFIVKAYNAKKRNFEPKHIVLKTDMDFFRLIGYYLAEGTVTGDHYVHFTFNVKEREYIEDVKALCEKYLGKKPLEMAEYNHGISLILCSTDAARVFSKQFGKHAAYKRVPHWVMEEAPEKQAKLVKGFWRGDGNYLSARYSSGFKNVFRMNTISEKLARQIRDMLLRNDILAGLNRWKRTGNRKDAYAVHIGGKYVDDFSKMVGTNEEVANEPGVKALMFNRQGTRASFGQIVGNYAFVPIRSIETREVENSSVYNFSVDEDESYVAGGVAVHNCSSPTYTSDSLHSAVVEIIALEGSRVQYTTIQNWYSDVYNLVTKRAKAYKDATMFWLDGNIGSKVTMKYPSVLLMEPGARGEVVSVALAGKGQHQDAGAKIFHLASNTSSLITSKSISKDGGRTTYRGKVYVSPTATNVKSNVECDALILDEKSASDTVPYMEIQSDDVSISHEASVSKLDSEKLFYLQSRGLSEEKAKQLLVQGFIEPFVKKLPMEYAVELNRLVDMEMEGSVG
ncbi:Fe-S cluster assembly protein SufB [Candidatus Micrarchaeota archaeon]|nr:Fe-S cluster assembly protein SufB [Candidatus Micrarchaeota archaeon]